MTAATENDVPNTLKTEAETPVKTEADTESKNAGEVKKEELEPITTDNVVVESHVAAKVVKQLEYYFGDRNLPQDRFMLREVTLDNGWIPLDTMLNFKRLASICSDKPKIAKAIEDSGSELLVINEDKNKVRRNPDKPLPKNTDELKLANNLKTVYVKGLPLDLTIDKAEELFSQFGKMSYVKLRKNADSEFKGSVFIEFVEQADADKMVATKELKFTPESDNLLIMSRNDYFKSKNQNVKQEKNVKREAQMGGTEVKHEVPEHVEYEKGKILKISELEGIETSREDMKTLFEGHGVSWVTFNKGDPEAYIRFEGSAQEALEKVRVDEKFILSGKESSPVVLDGTEEEEYWKKSAYEKAEFFNKKNRKRKFDGARGGRGRGRGGRGKRYRRD
ncbi:lupus La protein homolog A-like [Bolinopsis microptera]|uniref:lupus La protein homolog A-like n=1 Tax=Bolinopsis microptera TaxID=2820187 RepID=UPI003079D1A2